jgi:tripartite-type tricarboxylate transporter receptor subunit TctC
MPVLNGDYCKILLRYNFPVVKRIRGILKRSFSTAQNIFLTNFSLKLDLVRSPFVHNPLNILTKHKQYFCLDNFGGRVIFNSLERRKFMKKIAIFLLSLIVLMLGFSFKKSFPQEKEYPDKAIKIIVGTQPGGISDLGTRAWSDEFSKKLGVPVAIINQSGGGGTVAMVDTSTARPDGYTLATVTNTPMVVSPAITPNLPYDSTKDFIPIGAFGVTPILVAVNSNSPFKTIEELLDYAKKNPGKLNCGSAGTGTIAHFDLELIKFYAKVNIDHVPFKASPAAVTALLGNHIDLLVPALPPAIGHLKAGRIRGLLTTHKAKEFPNIPLFSEKGLAQAGIGVWLGLFAPAKIPKKVHSKLVETFEMVVKGQDVIRKLENVGLAPFYIGPDVLSKLVKEEFVKISEIAKIAGIKAE